MIILFLSSLFISFIITYLLIKYESIHINFSGDHDTIGTQKVHTEPVPRIGGVTIFVAVLASFLLDYNPQLGFLLVASLPIFIFGLLEDITNKIPPYIRLITAFISAGIAIYSLDIELTRTGWLWLDNHLLSLPIIAIPLTLLMIAGVCHATNIIDGLNGLLLGWSVLALGVFLSVALQVNDGLVVNIVLVLLGTVVGLLTFNFPQAKIFTGDGGAYLLGFLLAAVSLLLVKNNAQVSPWLPLLVLIYPVFETIFSIYRKKILRGRSPHHPDGMHMHMLIYKRVVSRNFLGLASKIGNNASASVLLWLVVLPFMLPSIFWWHSHLAMMTAIILFCGCYVWLYFFIVLFKNKLYPPTKTLK